MTVFGAAKIKSQWAKCVEAHTAHGGNKTQIRPKIEIGPLRDGLRLLTYANGMQFKMDEEAIASIAHSYSSLVCLVTGDASLLIVPFWMEVEAPAGVSRARAVALKALPAWARISIQLGFAALTSAIEDKKTKKSVKGVSKEIHDVTRAGFPEFCGTTKE